MLAYNFGRCRIWAHSCERCRRRCRHLSFRSSLPKRRGNDSWPAGLGLLEPHPQWLEEHAQVSIVPRAVADIVAAGISLSPELFDQGVPWVEPVLRVVSINVMLYGHDGGVVRTIWLCIPDVTDPAAG